MRTRRIHLEHSTLAGTISTIGMLFALGGCAVGPDFKRPKVDIAPNWSTADPRIQTRTATDATWWAAFEDPVLDDLVEQAYRQNLPLQVAGLRIVEARAQLGIATGELFPQSQSLNAKITATGLSKEAANVNNLDTRYVDYQAGFDAVWELDFWGKYRRGIEAEVAHLNSTVADYYYALVLLAAEVARTYTVIRTFETLIELAQKNVGLQEQGLDIAQSRFRNGATSELDVAQAATLLESTRSTIPQLETNLIQARNALATLLGRPAGTIDGVLVGPKQIPKAPSVVAVGLPAQILRRRPDVRSAELEAASQSARIGVAKADLYPSFSLFGSIGFQVSTGAGQHLELGTSLFYFAGPQIYWPFFNYGRIENSVRVQDARFQQLLIAYRQVVLRAAQEVEDAQAGFVKSQDALVFTERAVTSANRAVEIAFIQYREGAVDYQRVIDTERALLEQENNMTQTRSSVVTNLVALYKALGGGWQSRRGQPVVKAETVREMKDRTNWSDVLTEPKSQEKK